MIHKNGIKISLDRLRIIAIELKIHFTVVQLKHLTNDNKINKIHLQYPHTKMQA